MNKRRHLRRGNGRPDTFTACGIVVPRKATTNRRPLVTCDNCQRAWIYHRKHA